MAYVITLIISVVFYQLTRDKVYDYPVNPTGVWQQIPRAVWFLTSMRRVYFFTTVILIGAYCFYVIPHYTNIILLLLGVVLLNLISLQITIDIHSHLLPNKYNKYIGLLGILFVVMNNIYISALISVTAMFILALILSLFRVRGVNGIGAGDVKYIAVLSLFLTIENSFYGLLLGFVIGGVTILFLLIGGSVKRSEGVPYGPALSIGYLVVFVREGVFIG